MRKGKLLAAVLSVYVPFGPFTTRIQNPIYLTNLTLTPMRGVTLDSGIFEVRVDSASSNLFERKANGGNLVDLDMELLRLALDLRYGWRDGIEFGVEIPFLHFNGGFLDSFVDGFHETFGFPRGGRNRVPENRFSYRFDGNGTTLFNLSPRDFGIGDITLHLKKEILDEGDRRPDLSFFFDFKLPTGDRGKGFGSGNPDLGLGVAVEKTWGRFHGYANVASLALGGNDLIQQFQYGQMLAYMMAGEVSILDNLAVLVQLDGGTPLLKGTGTDQWDGVPLDLVIGLRGEEKKLLRGHDLLWQVGFAEDVTSRGPSIDFTAFLSIGARFNLQKGTSSGPASKPGAASAPRPVD